MNKIKLVMFDFDGTLVDTAPDLILATNQLLIRYGHPPQAPEVIRQDIGTGLKNLLFDFFPEARESAEQEEKLTQEFLEIYRSVYLNSPQMFSGVKEFLHSKEIQNEFKIAIVSNKREDLIHPILKKLQLDELPWVKIIGGDTLPTMKPDKAPLLLAIEAAQVAPAEAVIVGDGTPDIQGANAVGCLSVAVSFGYTPIQELLDLGAHSHIDDFKNLLSVLRSGLDSAIIDSPRP